MKFIHAADLHIDSPLLGLELFDGAPVERLRRATREAFSRLVDLALAEPVDLVLLAGDLFDGEWKDMRTGLWTAAQFRRLERAGIPVVMLRGNHDAASVVRKQITWPENVTELSVRSPQTWIREDLGIAVHGQGFAHRKCDDDLACRYPDRCEGLFNIGVLHTSLGGFSDHETYAPTSVQILAGKGYDYWALGHIHQRQPVPAETAIHYPGNTQGRHARETGPKGCLLSTIEDLHLMSVEFHPLDTVRWHHVELTLQPDHDLDELYAIAQQGLRTCHGDSDGRFCAVRVTLRGACEAHRAIIGDGRREEILAEIRNFAAGLDDEVWIEKIRLETAAPVDLAQLRRGGDLMGDLLRAIEEIRGDEDELIALSKELSVLAEKAPQELPAAGIHTADPEQLRGWLQQAEGLLVAQLVENDG